MQPENRSTWTDIKQLPKAILAIVLFGIGWAIGWCWSYLDTGFWVATRAEKK